MLIIEIIDFCIILIVFMKLVKQGQKGNKYYNVKERCPDTRKKI